MAFRAVVTTDRAGGQVFATGWLATGPAAPGMLPLRINAFRYSLACVTPHHDRAAESGSCEDAGYGQRTVFESVQHESVISPDRGWLLLAVRN